jgi:hypothetical protein
LITEEYIRVPKNRIGFITIKFSLKKKGLINISGFHVDPGFEGKLLFSVYNAGASPIPLTQGTDAFRMWLAELDGDAEPYKGDHQGQDCISENDISLLMGRVASPSALLDELSETKRHLQETVKWAKWIATAVIIPLAFLLISYFVSLGGASKGGEPIIIVNGSVGYRILNDTLSVTLADSVLIYGASKNSKVKQEKHDATGEGDSSGR